MTFKDQTFESSRIVERLGSVVAKEESIQRMLKLIKKHRSGIRQEELVRIIKNWGYRQKLIHQAIYFGIISETKGDELDDDISYHITEKGIKVLQFCSN